MAFVTDPQTFSIKKGKFSLYYLRDSLINSTKMYVQNAQELRITNEVLGFGFGGHSFGQGSLDPSIKNMKGKIMVEIFHWHHQIFTELFPKIEALVLDWRLALDFESLQLVREPHRTSELKII